MSYNALLNQLANTRQASGELLAILRDCERRIEPGFFRIERLLPESAPIDGSSERMREAASLLYLLYSFRQYLAEVKQEIERVNHALQHSLETLHAAVMLQDAGCLAPLHRSHVLNNITELSAAADAIIGDLIRKPVFTTAVNDYETLLETAEMLIQEELIKSRVSLGGEFRIVKSDAELEACVRDGSLLSVWKGSEPVYECGVAESFTGESVRIDGIHFARRDLTFAVRLLHEIH